MIVERVKHVPRDCSCAHSLSELELLPFINYSHWLLSLLLPCHFPLTVALASAASRVTLCTTRSDPLVLIRNCRIRWVEKGKAASKSSK